MLSMAGFALRSAVSSAFEESRNKCVGRGACQVKNKQNTPMAINGRISLVQVLFRRFCDDRGGVGGNAEYRSKFELRPVHSAPEKTWKLIKSTRYPFHATARAMESKNTIPPVREKSKTRSLLDN